MTSDPTSPSPTSPPNGFCPHCAYPMNPGRCSECGKNVSPDELLKFEPPLRLKRRVRHIIIIATIAVLATTGYQVFTRCNWESLLPSSFLLAMQNSASDKWSDELYRRLNAGELTKEEAFRAMRQTITTLLEVRSPHPQNEPLAVFLYSESGTPSENSGYLLKNIRVQVDNEPPVTPSGRFVEVGGNAGKSTQRERWIVPPLKPGKHTITLTGSLDLAHSASGLPWLPYVFPVTESVEVVVESKSVDAYLKGVWNAEMETLVAERVRIGARWSDAAEYSGVALRFSSRRLPTNFVCDIWIRRDSSEEFTPTGQSCNLPASRDFVHHTSELMMGISEIPKRVDVLLKPSPKAAFDAGLTEYLDATIEWRQVPISTDRRGYISANGFDSDVPPSSVSHNSEQATPTSHTPNRTIPEP